MLKTRCCILTLDIGPSLCLGHHCENRSGMTHFKRLIYTPMKELLQELRNPDNSFHEADQQELPLPGLLPKGRTLRARPWRWEMRCVMKSCLFSRDLQVNLGCFIGQVSISVLGNHYMFTVWIKCPSLLSMGICTLFKPLCNFRQTKASKSQGLFA